jgi:hypothetical protein
MGRNKIDVALEVTLVLSCAALVGCLLALLALELGGNTAAGLVVAGGIVGWLHLRIYRKFNGPNNLED